MVDVSIAKPGTNDWYYLAECRGSDLALFFPTEGERFNPTPAKLVCNGDPILGTHPCVVRDKCLDRAMRQARIPGVWGGLDEDERNAERRRQQRQTNSLRRHLTGPDEELSAPTNEPEDNQPTEPPAQHPATYPEHLTFSVEQIEAPGSRLARLVEYLATELLLDNDAVTVEKDPFLQELANALGHRDWDAVIESANADEVAAMLARRRCVVTVAGPNQLEQLATAVGFKLWTDARFKFIEGLAKAGIVKYLHFNHQLIVHVDLAQERLDYEERNARMPHYLWRTAARKNLEPAPVPPEYQHLVHETPGYSRTQPFKDGVVSDRHMVEIFRRIVLAGGELQDITVQQLADALGESKASVSRILQNLDAAGYIQRDKDGSGHVKPGSPLRLSGHGVLWMIAKRERYMSRFARQSA